MSEWSIKSRPCVFFLRLFNDADQIIPIIWKMKQLGLPVRVIFIDKNMNIDIHTHPLFVFLTRELKVPVHYYYALGPRWFRLPNRPLVCSLNPLALKLARKCMPVLWKLVFHRRWARRVLEEAGASVCVFDQQTPDAASAEGRFIQAAKELGIPIVSTPHGLYIFTNLDSIGRRKKIETKDGSKLDNSAQNVFDRIILCSPEQIPLWQETTVDMGKIRVLGSSRYAPEWLALNAGIWPPYCPKGKDPGRRLRVVFFMPKWDQKVKKNETLKAMREIADLEDVFLVIKEHTREGSGRLSDEERQSYRRRENADLIEGAPAVTVRRWIEGGLRLPKASDITGSTALLEWADCVVNFGSSVGIEAFYRKKLLVNPVYLHENETIFEYYGAGMVVNDLGELLDAIRNYRHARKIPYDTARFEENVIYGGNKPHDVLGGYCDMIRALGEGM